MASAQARLKAGLLLPITLQLRFPIPKVLYFRDFCQTFKPYVRYRTERLLALGNSDITATQLR